MITMQGQTMIILIISTIGLGVCIYLLIGIFLSEDEP